MIIDESKASRKVRFRRIHVVVFLSLWACLITSGMLVLTAYATYITGVMLSVDGGMYKGTL